MAAPTKIDSADPVTSFWQMLNDERTNKVADAMTGMATAVRGLLASCTHATDGVAMKGYGALREFRRGSLMCAREALEPSWNQPGALLEPAWREPSLTAP